jgi:hypothetical protein
MSGSGRIICEMIMYLIKLIDTVLLLFRSCSITEGIILIDVHSG